MYVYIYVFFYFFFNYLFNLHLISLWLSFLLGSGLMGRKKERERTIMSYDFAMFCAVSTKMCAVCGCVRVSCVGSGICGLWEGLRPSVSTRFFD